VCPAGNDLVETAVLSAVAGYVDAVGFLALFGMFTAHMTGEMVGLGAVFAERVDRGAAVRLAMLPVFALSVGGTALLARRFGGRGRASLAPLLTLLTAALALFLVTGIVVGPSARRPDSWAVALIGGTGVIAMGVQNALMRYALSDLSPTTIMTGNLTQVILDLVELAISGSGEAGVEEPSRAAAARRVRKFGVPVVGFVLGSVLGAYVTRVVGLGGVALPTCAAGLLAASSWRAATGSAQARPRERSRAGASLSTRT
jgi:uncharacterized membrane protein YoaK (UPF0700 family)